MPDIVLATFNARYIHSAFGLRYLLANMGELREQTVLREFGISDRSCDVVEQLLEGNPRIVGIGVYIWNVELALRVVADLKRVRPDVIVVLGGPEVSYELETQPLVELADYIITGEGDLAFAELCRQLLTGTPPDETIIAAPIPQFGQLKLPYDLYTEEDIAQRVLYVEASRGCPFTCEFCLSALEIPVRAAELDRFLAEMQTLLDRGAKQFKFVDRTFNLNLRFSQAILQFFLDRYTPGLFLHFEMIPDRLPASLQTLIRRFPAGSLQFEIGVQTFNDEVGDRISRKQDNDKLAENFRFLRAETGVHIHADLIVGLPGETMESFGTGFDRLIDLDPQEIQVGMLKRLRGTPIVRHEMEWQLAYSDYPPYEILSTGAVRFETMQRLRRFARFWDLIGNSGHFRASRDWIWRDAPSPFVAFLALADGIYEHEQRTHGIALPQLMQRVFDFLIAQHPDHTADIALALWEDHTRNGREDRPKFLRPFTLPPAREMHAPRQVAPQRQARHLS